MKIKKIIFLMVASILFLIGGCQKYGQKECSGYPLDNCPDGCRPCPPCESCSSLACNTIEFCDSIGFDREWHDNYKKSLENPKSDSEKESNA